MSERPYDPGTEDELEPLPDDDIEADELENDEPTTEEGDAALLAAAEEAPLASIAAVGGAIESERETRPMRPSERRAMRAAMEHGQVASETSHRVSDQPSAIFVLVTVGVFVLILLNGLILGHGGLLTPIPTPSPVPSVTATPVPSATVAPSGSAAASASPAVTPAPTATPGAS